MNRRPFTFDRVIRIFFTICIVIAAILLLDKLKGVLLPFLVSCIIAYTLEPLVKVNKRLLHMRSRVPAVILTLLECTVVVVGLFVILVPYLTEEMSTMGEIIRKYARTTMSTPYLPKEVHQFLQQNVDFERISRIFTKDEWKTLISKIISGGWSFLSSGLGFIFGLLSWLIVFLYVLFIMIDYEKLRLSFRQLIPHSHRNNVMGVINDIRNAMHSYFRGQCLIAFIVGLLFAAGFWLVGLPMGVALGLFIGVLNLVPYLQLISLPITAILCLISSVEGSVDFWAIFWECMAVYIVVQSIQDLILTPKIMGNAMGLNPAIILLSLSVWGSLLGFLGLVIALPLTTLLLSYYDRFVVAPYKKHQRHAADRSSGGKSHKELPEEFSE